MALTYLKGALLDGTIPVSILWYGEFSPAQKSIIVDFLLSLNSEKYVVTLSTTQPAVQKWWHTIQTYMKKAGKKGTHIVLAKQFSDKNCSSGRILKRTQVFDLAKNVNSKSQRGLTLVLTAIDVTVEGFCTSNCGFHGYNTEQNSAFIRVGNSMSQCPGHSINQSTAHRLSHFVHPTETLVWME